ncbi:MAG: hypothetical protein RLZ25_1568 [Pseudomonadota bacterium]
MSANDSRIEGFRRLAHAAFAMLSGDEDLGLSFSAENQNYVRFNQGRVRQATHVDQQRVTLDFRQKGRRLVLGFDLTGSLPMDQAHLAALIGHARDECSALPQDPFVTPLENHGEGHEAHPGILPSVGSISNAVFNASQNVDLAGLYAGGTQIRATANAEGTFRSFSSESFFLDHSIYTVNADGENKAVKGLYAGNVYEEKALHAALSESCAKLPALNRNNKTLPRGSYRVFLAPQAVEALMGMLSWGAVSHGAYQRGECAFEGLARGDLQLSPLFSLKENFRLGLSPRFTATGTVAPEELLLIERGELRTLLIHERTAKEYGLTANGASGGEGLRSPEILCGDLDPSDALKRLGTGIYLGNLHYLNWSERKTARLTGMTRYACFWVEDGEIMAPIKDLRFDESLYRIFGSELEAITQNSLRLPETDTYQERSLGGSQVPGMLIRDFRFTL